MITLIGTGHVFDISDSIRNILDDKSPDIICVELDAQRYNAIMLKKTNPEKYQEARKKTPFLYKMLGDFQDGIAKQYGVSAGDEMLSAIKYSQEHQLPFAFIDREARNLFQRMIKEMSISEKFRLFFSGFAGLFVSKKKVESEIEKLDRNFDSYLEQVSDKFPTIKRVLIDERNEFMTKKLLSLTSNYENIVAVMGDGHVPGIEKMLSEKNVEFNTIRLRDLRKKTDLKAVCASFSVNYKYVE